MFKGKFLLLRLRGNTVKTELVREVSEIWGFYGKISFLFSSNKRSVNNFKTKFLLKRINNNFSKEKLLRKVG